MPGRWAPAPAVTDCRHCCPQGRWPGATTHCLPGVPPTHTAWAGSPWLGPSLEVSGRKECGGHHGLCHGVGRKSKCRATYVAVIDRSPGDTRGTGGSWGARRALRGGQKAVVSHIRSQANDTAQGGRVGSISEHHRGHFPSHVQTAAEGEGEAWRQARRARAPVGRRPAGHRPSGRSPQARRAQALRTQPAGRSPQGRGARSQACLPLKLCGANSPRACLPRWQA